MIVSDATIRRWCGPEWRIAASRRTRARATIAEMTMRHADALINSAIAEPSELSSVGSMPGAGTLWLTDQGVWSDQYGTLDFQTPIVELGLTTATKQEIELYEGWRTQYERQWRKFDPIALKVFLEGDSVSADLSVIPLLIRSEYRGWLDWVGEMKLNVGKTDSHPESIASLDIALDLQSNSFSFARGLLNQQGGMFDLLSWIDGSVSLYLDHDQAWIDRLFAQPEFRFSPEEMLREVPIGVFVPSKDRFRMTAFVVALRGMMERFAPNMFRWDQVDHRGLTYVVGTPIGDTMLGDGDDLPKVYYVPTPEGMTFSLNKNVIVRAVDRYLARSQVRAEERENTDTEPAVVGRPGNESQASQIAMRISGQGAATLAASNFDGGVRRMSRLAWSNIPILNYFRHRYPAKDPQTVYEELLGETLVEPGGGDYVWVERFKTYQSTLYGHHLAPRSGPPVNPALLPSDRLETTLSFQDGGLRATLGLTRSKKEGF